MESYRNLPVVYIATINSLAKVFSDMAETCPFGNASRSTNSSLEYYTGLHHDSSSSDQRVHAQAEHFSENHSIIGRSETYARRIATCFVEAIQDGVCL